MRAHVAVPVLGVGSAVSGRPAVNVLSRVPFDQFGRLESLDRRGPGCLTSRRSLLCAALADFLFPLACAQQRQGAHSAAQRRTAPSGPLRSSSGTVVSSKTAYAFASSSSFFRAS